MGDFEKRVAAARKVVDEGESGRYEEICGEEDERMGRYLIVEWDDHLATYAATCADLLTVKYDVDAGPRDGYVTEVSVHDLDQDGKMVGEVEKSISFRFIPPE